MANLLAKEVEEECITDLKERFPEESQGTIVQLSKLEPIALGIQYVSSLNDCIRESNARYLMDELEFIQWDCNGVKKLSFENCGIRCSLYNENNVPMVELDPPSGKPQLHLYHLLLKWAGMDENESSEGTTEDDLVEAAKALS
jgi:hypothetical protein